MTQRLACVPARTPHKVRGEKSSAAAGNETIMSNPTTRIGTPTSDTDRFRMRGKDVLSEIIGEMSFTEAFYFIVTGRELTKEQAKTFDACVIILMDHGITPQALVARVVEHYDAAVGAVVDEAGYRRHLAVHVAKAGAGHE